jgi:prolyl-tRNA editing enzyme YbaK/EbsC (Cys-tRNA(Pro) deacylase)
MAIEAIKGEASIDRVARAAKAAGLEISILKMEQSTRTAQEAADACGCEVGQIIKSLIFALEDRDELILVLVSGANTVDTDKLEQAVGAKIGRADPRVVRDQTGFAIGGVAAIGHLIDLQTIIDQDLLQYDTIWSAAGKPNAVFEVETKSLLQAIGGMITELKQ